MYLTHLITMSQPFGALLDLVSLAEQVHKLSAVCMLCFRNASFTRRLVDDEQGALAVAMENH